MVIAKVNLSGNINSRMARQLREVFSYIEHSKKIKALLLTMNSGGGEASSSEILMECVKKIKKIKPVFTMIEGLGASGAYWIASASTKIYAMNTSITGSIGVIALNPNVTELLQKLGVKMDVLKMGEYKDMLNPFTETNDVAKQKYSEILEFSYSVFKNSVAENRNISPENIEKIATGEIFSSDNALKLGLIDKIGSLEDPIKDLIDTYGLKKKIREYSPRRTIFERMVSSSMGVSLIDRFIGIQ